LGRGIIVCRRHIGQRDPVLQVQFTRSSTFRWALAVAAVLAIFIIALFGFIYTKIDHYLIARSDHMIMTQVDFIASLPPEHRISAIEYHLGQDSRNVQFAGLFDARGNRLAGNLERMPDALRVDAAAQSVKATRTRKEFGDPLIRAIGRRLPDGDALVIGRNVDETTEISQVVGEALALGLLPAFCLCLLAGAWLSLRAQRHVDEVNQRVQRIIGGNLHERLPHRNIDEPFSRLAVIVNGMLDEMEAMIHALSGVGNDIAHDLRTPLTRAPARWSSFRRSRIRRSPASTSH
jgi:signal transduction histidine kinase